MAGEDMRRGSREADAARGSRSGAARPAGAKRRKKKAGLPLWIKAGAALGLAALGVGGAIFATQQRGAHSQDPLRVAMALPPGGATPSSAPRPRAETAEIWARLTSGRALSAHFASVSGDARTHLHMLEALAADPGLRNEATLRDAVRRAEAGDLPPLTALAQTAHDENAPGSAARRNAAILLGTLLFSNADPEGGARLLQEAAEASPEEVGSWGLLARALFLLGRHEEALAALERADRAARDDFGRLAAVNARIDLSDLLEGPEALTALAEEGLSLAGKLARAEPSDAAAQREHMLAAVKRADAALLSGDAEDADARYAEARSLARGLAEAHPARALHQRDLGELDLKIGQVAAMRGDLEGARQGLESYLAVARRLSGAAPQNLRALTDLGLTLSRIADLDLATETPDKARERFQEALGVFESAVEIAPQDLESTHNLSVTLQRLGDLALAGGNLDEARQRFERNFAMDRRLAEENPEFAPAQAALAAALRRMGDLALAEEKPEEARSRFQASLDIDEKLHLRYASDPEATTNLVGSLIRLAQTAEPAQARSHYERALGLLRPLAEQELLAPQHAQGIPVIEELMSRLPPA